MLGVGVLGVGVVVGLLVAFVGITVTASVYGAVVCVLIFQLHVNGVLGVGVLGVDVVVG